MLCCVVSQKSTVWLNMLPPSWGLMSKQETSKQNAVQFSELTKYKTKCLPCCSTRSEMIVKKKEQSQFYNKSLIMSACTDLFVKLPQCNKKLSLLLLRSYIYNSTPPFKFISCAQCQQWCINCSKISHYNLSCKLVILHNYLSFFWQLLSTEL